ncbi:MAG: N-6 DNA methylase [Bacteroidales bacterium]|nr:N-6 DNA methylase [Bacteroidales bacterium]
MITKESAFQKISELVERFEEQYTSYMRSEYNETLTRRDFIDPFFKALGWDMDNEQGYAEAYREVIHEDRLRIGTATKAPDYSFKLAGGKRLFFVEAKKPGVSVKDEIQPAYQIRRYGWSAKLPISIITDFQELSIYDCTVKPNPTDKASVARIGYLTFHEYLSKFDFIWDTFSKERVLKGSFDKFVQSDTQKKGTATVDKEFLQSLDRWRTYLATSISWNNKGLDEDEINFAVQQTIDRIIFLRIAEDRSVEPYGNLKHTLGHGEFYQNLFEQFRKADEKYNSGLFDFHKDRICEHLKIDNKVIKTLINEMYYPECPYEFSVLSVEILGSAYEQFLGKVIRITPAHHAKIEEKPEVRKAGGVYYTPQYIVEYIVKNTVGKLVEGKTPAEVEKIKIVDPACGSGSFLIGAYQYLLDWHLNYYNSSPVLPVSLSPGQDKGTRRTGDKGKSAKVLTPDGNLTTAEKKRILLNNIYGVDIDVNAVEVTKLSLLLKCLEGETEASIQQQFSLWNERVLPTLDNNIKSGNSLIDTDFYGAELDFGLEKKIKPFNWQNAFPEVFKQGGFDAVIGNPPYVRQELLGDQKDYFKSKYEVFHGMADLYSYFIERGIGLLNEKGLFGIIVANKWMRSNYGEPLRKWLKLQNIISIIDFGDLPVFEGVTTYPCILICGKVKVEKSITITNIKTLNFESLENYIHDNQLIIEQTQLEDCGWNLASDTEQKLLRKIQSAGITLGRYVQGKIFRGVLTGLNEAFVIDTETRNRLIQEDEWSAEIIKPFLIGRDVKKYQKPASDKFLIFTRRGININDYLAIKNHLEKFKKSLIPKPKDFKGDNWEGRKPGSYKWHEIQDAVDYYLEFEKPKIIYPNILKKPEFTYDNEGWYTNQKCFIISLDDKYLLGILNSNLVYYLFEKYLPKLRGGFYEPSYIFLKNFPIKEIDLDNNDEKFSRNEIIKLVDQLLKLNEEIKETKLQTQIDQIKSKINYCESRINEIVYQLYGLTEEEIRIVEGKD